MTLICQRPGTPHARPLSDLRHAGGVDQEAFARGLAADDGAGERLALREAVKVAPLVRLPVRNYVGTRAISAVQAVAARVAGGERAVEEKMRTVHGRKGRAVH